MQDEANRTTPSTEMALHNHMLPSDSYSLIGEDLIKHSFSDEDSSGDQSDVEIDLWTQTLDKYEFRPKLIFFIIKDKLKIIALL